MLLLINAMLVKSKSSLTQDLIMDKCADLASISDTWLEELETVSLSIICPTGFSIRHQARLGSWMGGTAVVY